SSALAIASFYSTVKWASANCSPSRSVLSMMRNEVMLMSSECAGGQKKRAPSRKGLFAESDPVLTACRHLIRAQRNPLLGSETAFLARRTDVFTTGCSVAAVDRLRQPPILSPPMQNATAPS